MPDATTTRRERPATHRRGAVVTDRILRAATEEIVERRSVDISMDDVAERAGVNKTTVYRRWSSSPELVAAAVQQRAEDAVPIPDTGDLRTDLVELCRAVAGNLSSPLGHALSVAGMAGEGGTSGELQQLIEVFWSGRFAAAGEILTRHGHASNDPVPVETKIEWLVGPIHFRILERRAAVDDDYIEHLVDSFLSRV